MPFTGVYELSDYETAAIYRDMAENFYNDDLYRTIFPNEKSRKRLLKYFFKHYLAAIRPFSHFVADSKKKNCVAVIYDSRLEISWKYHLRLLLLNIKMVPMLLSLHSFQSIWHVIRCWDMFTSRWVKEFVSKDAYHVDMLFTKKEARGQGLAKHMLEIVCADAKEQGMDVTMETHHEGNLPMYERAGFKLMSVITHETYDLKQFCLLVRNDRGGNQ